MKFVATTCLGKLSLLYRDMIYEEATVSQALGRWALQLVTSTAVYSQLASTLNDDNITPCELENIMLAALAGNGKLTEVQVHKLVQLAAKEMLPHHTLQKRDPEWGTASFIEASMANGGIKHQTILDLFNYNRSYGHLEWLFTPPCLSHLMSPTQELQPIEKSPPSKQYYCQGSMGSSSCCLKVGHVGTLNDRITELETKLTILTQKSQELEELLEDAKSNLQEARAVMKLSSSLHLTWQSDMRDEHEKVISEMRAKLVTESDEQAIRDRSSDGSQAELEVEILSAKCHIERLHMDLQEKTGRLEAQFQALHDRLLGQNTALLGSSGTADSSFTKSPSPTLVGHSSQMTLQIQDTLPAIPFPLAGRSCDIVGGFLRSG